MQEARQKNDISECRMVEGGVPYFVCEMAAQSLYDLKEI